MSVSKHPSTSRHELDLSTWHRHRQFEFFKDFALPFFNLCVEVPVTPTHRFCREHKRSFSLACWFACQQAVNAIPEFRYRLRDGKVWVYDRISISTTQLNEDESFRFCYFPYQDHFDAFEREARAVIDAPPSESMEPRADDDSVIHGTTIPWLTFTSITHPQASTHPSRSIPKITFGRYAQRGEQLMMPVSVEVHHALMDGLHAARFFEVMTQHFAEPERHFMPES